MLKLLSLLQSRQDWPGPELAARLEVSTRTLRRDVDSLRSLGYPVEAAKGPYGGYQLGGGSRLPPLVFDNDQAVAIALALQTAPAAVSGFHDAARRALATIKQVMPPSLRDSLDAMDLTSIRNSWDFAAPPLAAGTLTAVGTAVQTQQILAFDYERSEDGSPVQPLAGNAMESPTNVEPHHLALWAGRWYLVAFVPVTDSWHIYRLDRVHPRPPTGRSFSRRELPYRDVAEYVTTHHDRGDTPAKWQCLGSAVLDLPAHVVARWAPGGSVIAAVDDNRSRLTLGAWSWTGIAGLLSTFDADLDEIEPAELRRACELLSARLASALKPT
jgi:predicted DNA-binding transcriptional regulator YafY